jgi:hypothetical protein
VPGPSDDVTPPTGWPTSIEAPNPRTYPARAVATVNADLARADLQRRELEASMATTGQTGALVIAALDAVTVPVRGACTATTWAEGPTTVLPQADVLVLFELPATIDGAPRTTRVRWDVAARVCGPTCWRVVPGIDPLRIITRTWPSPAELDVMRALSLPDDPA